MASASKDVFASARHSRRRLQCSRTRSASCPSPQPPRLSPLVLPCASESASEWSAPVPRRHSKLHTFVLSKTSTSSFLTSLKTRACKTYSPSAPPVGNLADACSQTNDGAVSSSPPVGLSHRCTPAVHPAFRPSPSLSSSLSPSLSSSLSRLPAASASSTLASLPFLVHSVSSRPFFLTRLASSLCETKKSLPSDAVDPSRSKSGRGRRACKHAASVWSDSAHDKRKVACFETGYLCAGQDPLEMHAGCIQTESSFFLLCGSPTQRGSLSYGNSSAVSSAVSSCSRRLSSFSSDLVWSSAYTLAPTLALPSSLRISASTSVCSSSSSDSPPCSFFVLRACPSRSFSSRPYLPPISTATPCSLSFGSLRFLASQSSASPSEGDRGRGDTRDDPHSQGDSPDAAEEGKASAQTVGEDCASPDASQCPTLSAADWCGDSQAQVTRRPDSVSSVVRSDSASSPSSAAPRSSSPSTSSSEGLVSTSPLDSSTVRRHDAELAPTSLYKSSLPVQPPGAVDIHDEDMVAWYHLFDELQFTPHWQESTLAPHAGAPEHPHRHRSPSSAGALASHFGPPFYDAASLSHSPSHSFPSFLSSLPSSGPSSSSSYTAASSPSSASHPSSSSSLFSAFSSFPAGGSPSSLRLPAHASQAEGAAVAAAAAAVTARRMAAVAEALEWNEEMNRLFISEGKTRASQEIGRKTGFLARRQDHPTRLSDERHTRHAPRHSGPSSLVRRPPSSASSLQPPRELYVNYQFPVLAHAALKGLYDRLFRSRKQTLSFSKRKRTGGLKTRGEPDRRRALHASPSTSATDPPLPSRSSEGSRRERPGTGRTMRSDYRRGGASRGSTDLVGRNSRTRRRTGWMSTPGVDANFSLSQDATQDLDALSPDTICTDSFSASPQCVGLGVSGEKADESSSDSQAGRETRVSHGCRVEATGKDSFSAAETSAFVRSDLLKEEPIVEERTGGNRRRQPVLGVANATLQMFSRGGRVAPATTINASEKGEALGASQISSEYVQRDRQVPVHSKPVRADMLEVEDRGGDSVRGGFPGREAPLARQLTAPEVESLVDRMRAHLEPRRIGDQRAGESRGQNRSSAEQPLQSNSGSASMIGRDPTASEGFGKYLETVVARNDHTEFKTSKQERVWTKSSLPDDALGSPLQEAPPVTREDVERATATFHGPVVVEAPCPSFPPRKPPEIAPAFPFAAEESLKPQTVDGRHGNFLVLSKTAESLERSLMRDGVWTRLACLASSLADQIRFVLLPSAYGSGTPQLRARQSGAPQSGASPFFQRLRGSAGMHFASLQARASEWCYQNGNVLVTTGSVLSLTGTVMADMRLLRGFNLLAGICFFSYNYTRRPSMTDAAAWNVVFFTLNFFMLYRYLTEHNEVGFTNDELDVFEKYFLPAGLSPRRFRTLLSIGRWETLPAGSELTRPGEPVKKLVFILRGRVDVYQHGDLLEQYTGTDGTPVIGLEAFLSYVSALRRLATLGEATKKSKLPPSPLGPGGSDAGSDSAAVGCPQSLDVQERRSSGDSGQEALKEDRPEVQAPLRESAVNGVRGDTHADATSLSRELGGCGSPGGRGGAGSGEGTPETKGEIRDDDEEGEESERAGSRLTPGWVGDVLLASDRTGKSQAGDHRVDTETPVTVAGAGISSDSRSSETTHGGVPVTGLRVSARIPNAPEGHGEKEEDEEEEGLLLPPLKQREGLVSTETCAPEVAVNAATHTRASYFHEAAVVSEEEEDEEEDEAIWSRFLRSGRRRGPRGMLREEEEARSTQEKEIAESLESGRASDKRAVCATDCDVLVFDIETAARFILDDPVKIGFPVLQGLASVLVERSYAQSLRLAINSYDSVVAGVLADGAVQTEERSFLEEWRARRGISDAQHIEALRRCGWSLEDFERGERHRPDGGVAGTVGRAVYSVLTLNFLRNGSQPRDGSAAGGTGEEAQKPVASEEEKREEKRTDGMGGTTALLGSRLEASRTGAEKKGEGTEELHAVSNQEGEANRNTNSEETTDVGGVASRLRSGAQPGKGTSPGETDRVGGEFPRERKKISDCEAGNSDPTQSHLSTNLETSTPEPRPVDGSGGYTA
ncbi:UNVERIFIED_CONTAM: hypothetical protein HHA_203520 [Hammondia hammondi]|eukprot:XP_008884637.1 hypothetical protein HHA_203520 [Hammondia hammondi]